LRAISGLTFTVKRAILRLHSSPAFLSEILSRLHQLVPKVFSCYFRANYTSTTHPRTCSRSHDIVSCDFVEISALAILRSLPCLYSNGALLWLGNIQSFPFWSAGTQLIEPF
jgi:hypothetical protein